MKKVFEFDDACGMEIALKNLRRYNQAMYISVDEKHIDSNLAEKFFRSKEGSEERLQLRKVIRAAAIMSCNDNPDIPSKYKQKVGDRMSREFVSSMEAAAVDFQYFSGEFGMPGTPKAEEEREKRHKEIAIVRKTHFIDRTTKKIRKGGFRIVEKKGLEGIISIIVDDEPTIKYGAKISGILIGIIPDDFKEKAKQKTEELFEKAGNALDTCKEKFEHTSFGRKAIDVYEKKVEPVIQKGYDKVSSFCSTVKQEAKRLWTGLKSFFA